MRDLNRKPELAVLLYGTMCSLVASATNWYVSPDGTGGGTSPTDHGAVDMGALECIQSLGRYFLFR